MTLKNKPLTELDEADLQDLVQREVSEGREIEYKSQLPGTSDSEKREFLSDVSSFANCVGGDLIFGIREEQGVPVDIMGVQPGDLDSEKLRFENLLRDGVEPRIVPSVAIQHLALANSKVVMIVRSPRSLANPHAVTLGRSLRFYSRNSAGKYPLDLGEVRNAFLGGQELATRLRNFRLERIGLITGNQAPN